MKKLFFAVAALAALFITSCQENLEPQEIEGQVISAYTFNFTVSGTDDATKAIKTGWENGDIINLWFDGATDDPQAILTYDGETWVGKQLATDLVLGEEGRVTALYEGHNDLSKLVNNVPLVLENENAKYLADGSIVYAELNNWYYETPIQLVVPGITADYADYSLSCEDLYAGSSLFKGCTSASGAKYTNVSITNASYGKATTGVQNGDGAAFYFKSSNSNESKPFTFTLSYNGKDYTYTSRNTVIGVTDMKNRVNKKLPEFKIDENGNPVSGCKWSLVGGEDPVNGYVKVTTAPSDWSGEYLLVYEGKDVNYCWTGVDAGQCHVDATITAGVIDEIPGGAVSLIIEPMDGGYSIKINGGDNDGKYIGKSAYSNGIDIEEEPQLNIITISNDSAVISGEGKDNSGAHVTMRYNSSTGVSNERFRYYKTGQGPVQLYKSTAPFVAKQPQTLSFPESSYEVNLGETFTAPTVSGAQTTVTYSSSDTDVATVDASTGAITIEAAGETIITATAAADDTYRQGSASYILTVIDPNAGALTTIAAIFEASAKEDTYKVAFDNWVVSGVSGSNAYVTDGSKGFIIYKSGHGFVVGDILSGTVNSCALKRFNGAAEFTNISSTTVGLTITKNGTVKVNETLSIEDLSGVNTGALISLAGLTYDGTVLSDGSNNITPYNKFYSNMSFETGYKYNVTGIYIQFDSTKEIAPRSAADIVEAPVQKYGVTIADDIDNGSVTANKTEAPAGATVTLTATPAIGYQFDSWSVKDAFENVVTVTGNSFTMPASAVTVSASFIQSEGGQGGTIASGTILWAENFAHFGTNTPSAAGTGNGTTIYGNATITYSQSSTNTKGYNETLAGGTAPELLLSKSNQTWTITGICCDGASKMTLTFLSNKTTFAVSSSTEGITVSSEQKSWTITNNGAKTFDITIKNTGSSNARIDNVELKVN